MVRLGQVLKEQGVKQKDFATMIGKSKQTVNNWCTGNIPPSLENIYLASEILGVPAYTLIADYDNVTVKHEEE